MLAPRLRAGATRSCAAGSLRGGPPVCGLVPGVLRPQRARACSLLLLMLVLVLLLHRQGGREDRGGYWVGLRSLGPGEQAENGVERLVSTTPVSCMTPDAAVLPNYMLVCNQYCMWGRPSPATDAL